MFSTSLYSRMFDDDDDGHLSVTELTEVVTELGDTLSKAELKQMIRQARYQDSFNRHTSQPSTLLDYPNIACSPNSNQFNSIEIIY